jgi:hypothetical protein
VNLVLVGLIAATLLIPLLWCATHKRFDIFDPLVWFAVAYGVMFVGRPLEMIVSNDFLYRSPSSSIDVHGGFTKMLVVALIGAWGFMVGYFLSWGAKLSTRWAPSRARSTRWSAVSASAFAVLGILAFVVFLVHAGGLRAFILLTHGRTPASEATLGGLSFYPWTAILVLIPAALALWALASEHRSIAAGVGFSLLTLVLLLHTVPLGMRLELGLFVGALVVFSCLRRGARPNGAVIAAVIVFSLFLSATLSDLRGRSTRNESVGQSLEYTASHPGHTFTYVLRGSDSEMAVVLSAALKLIPVKLGYAFGGVISRDFVSRPIPRAVWPGKPEPARDKMIAALLPPKHGKQSVNPEFSVLLYPFWDFGYLGVAVALLVFGIGARWLNEVRIAHTGDVFVQLLVSIALWLVVLGLRNSPVDTFVEVVFVVGPLVVIFGNVGWRRRKLVQTCGKQYQAEAS